MVREEVLGALKPEAGKLREHFPLPWDPRREDHIKHRDPIGCHDEQLLAEVVDVAHLPALGRR